MAMKTNATVKEATMLRPNVINGDDDRQMCAVWSDGNKFGTWLIIETEVARAMAQRKIIPESAMRAINSAHFDIDRIKEEEAAIGHDFLAFLHSISSSIPNEHAKYLHYGLTSSDIVDTALAINMKQAAAIISTKIESILDRLKQIALYNKTIPCVGRTHGIIAEPTTVGLKFALWYDELRRAYKRFQRAVDTILVGKISGAVGNFANVSPEVEQDVCERLGLRPAKISTQIIQRDRHAEFIIALTLIGTSLEKFATEIRNLQRTEINELAEGFTDTQKGSSSMPHKRNPITAERITGIARVLRGYALTAMENIPLWHERDLTHSAAERVIIPGATIMVSYALTNFNRLICRLKINENQMFSNIFRHGGTVFSQQILLKLIDRMRSRKEAYDLIQKYSARTMTHPYPSFRALIIGSREISPYLSIEEIGECFKLSYYMKHVNTIFDRVFGEENSAQ